MISHQETGIVTHVFHLTYVVLVSVTEISHQCMCYSPYGHKLFSGMGTAHMDFFCPPARSSTGTPCVVMGISVFAFP